jgi:hypothetical protein
MTPKHFFKTEHIILKIIYLIGIISFVIHLFNASITSFNEENIEHLYSIIAYSIMTLFIVRLSIQAKRNKK